MSDVKVSEICKEYKGFSLKDVSFEIKPGRITGFIGRNGAGKTTVIKSMLGLVHPSGGKAEYFGKSFYGNEAEIKRLIGYSAGTVNWYKRKKLRDIVKVIEGFYDGIDKDAFNKYLNVFGLDLDKSASELSEGMKVKFNLLLALSHNARVLILDEPTSGLDPFSRNELLDIFKELKKDGIAVFFSTHIISDIEKCADDIIYISRGRIVASLPKEEFIKTFSEDFESLEDTFLRLEGSGRDA